MGFVFFTNSTVESRYKAMGVASICLVINIKMHVFLRVNLPESIYSVKVFENSKKEEQRS